LKNIYRNYELSGLLTCLPIQVATDKISSPFEVYKKPMKQQRSNGDTKIKSLNNNQKLYSDHKTESEMIKLWSYSHSNGCGLGATKYLSYLYPLLCCAVLYVVQVESSTRKGWWQFMTGDKP